MEMQLHPLILNANVYNKLLFKDRIYFLSSTNFRLCLTHFSCYLTFLKFLKKEPDSKDFYNGNWCLIEQDLLPRAVTVGQECRINIAFLLQQSTSPQKSFPILYVADSNRNNNTINI